MGECGGHWTLDSSNSVEDEYQLWKTLSLYSSHYRVNLSDQLVIELNCRNQQMEKDHISAAEILAKFVICYTRQQ